MRPATIGLTDEERSLLDQIHFGSTRHDHLRASMAPMAELSRRLLQRGAIPEHRLRYFTDPECNPGGRGKSRADVFERNGTCGDEIVAHPNFMKYLEYFIFGPDLPDAVFDEFKACASIDGHLSGEDVTDFISKAKAFVRARGLTPAAAAEEFFKLALESGASPWAAGSLRSAVRSIRS